MACPHMTPCTHVQIQMQDMKSSYAVRLWTRVYVYYTLLLWMIIYSQVLVHDNRNDLLVPAHAHD